MKTKIIEIGFKDGDQVFVLVHRELRGSLLHYSNFKVHAYPYRLVPKLYLLRLVDDAWYEHQIWGKSSEKLEV